MTKELEEMVSGIELRDFPADVQDMLKQRAVERCVSIEVVIQDYVVETSALIAATQDAAA